MNVLKAARYLGSIFYERQLTLKGGKTNPVLRRELRRYGMAEKRGTVDPVHFGLQGFTRRYGCLLPLCFAIGAICMCSGLPRTPVAVFIAPFAALVFFGGIAFSILANLYYIVVAIQSAGHDIGSTDWDTVRVTLLSSEDIVQAKYTIGMLRVWRVVVIETGLRMSTAVFLFVVLVFASLWARSILNALLYFAAFSMPILVFVLEPFWRTQALASLGVAIAARFNNMTFAFLAGFGAVLALLMSLIAPLWSLGLLVGRTLFTLPMPSELRSWVQIAVFLLGCGIIYGFYGLIKYLSLHRAAVLVSRVE